MASSARKNSTACFATLKGPAVTEQRTVDPDHREPELTGEALVVAFTLAGERYGLRIEDVQEVQQIVALSGVRSGAAVVGMLDLRGEVIPALDVRTLVGLPAKPYSLQTPMLIARGPEGPVALLVDEVHGVVALSDEALQPAPSLHSMHEVLGGVARVEDGLISVVDLDLMLGQAKGADR